MAIPNYNYQMMREDGGIDYASDSVDQAASNTVSNTTSNMVRDYQGKEYDPAVILNLSKQIAASIDPNAIKGGVFTTKGESVGFNYDEATKLLGREPNSAEQVFLDMARHLAKEGVTDLKNADLTETNRRFGSTFTGGGGTIYEIKKDASGNPIISTWSKDTSDKGAILGALAIAGLAFGVPALFGEAVAGTAGLTASELAVADMALGGLGGTAGATALAESALLGASGAGALATQNAFELANAGASALTETAGLSTLGAETAGGLLTGAETAAASTLGGEAAATLGADAGLLTGGAGTVGTTGLTAAEAAGLGLNATEAASLGLSASEFAAAGGLGAFTAAGLPSGVGTFLGENVVSGIPAFDAAFTSAGGLFNPTFGLPVGGGAFLGEGVPTGIPASDTAFLNAGGTFNPAFTLAPDGLLGTPPVVPPVAPPVAPPVVPPVVPPTGLPPSITTPLINAGIGSAVNNLLGGGGTNLSNLLSGGLGTAGNLLQMQQSREATQAAQARVDAETAAAKQAAQFRPVGMTTKFGTSQFTYDPVTGQMVSAGYQLTPEAKAQQDRLTALSNQGLTQAEQAQAQFAPLQQGAQSLFGLGNKYLAQSPEEVAQRYINQQMQLLQPSREQDLASLQNRLQQQGRAGLSVAQGGTLGATTPELQALYNARAQQELALAAQAQQAGQQQVSFGAGLLGQGASAMGQYYGGQQAAYAPYTTAMGQVQGLEALGQQPFALSQGLAQQQAQAGANVGRLGLTGAQLSTNLATSADATRNLGAQALIAAGNPNAQFGQALGNVFGGLLTGGVPPMTAMSTPATGYGAGNYYGNQDVLGVWSS